MQFLESSLSPSGNTLSPLSVVVLLFQLCNTLIKKIKYEEAEQMFRKTLMLREKVLGEEHTDTIASKKGLASILRVQDKDEEIEPLAAAGAAEQKDTNTTAHLDNDPSSSPHVARPSAVSRAKRAREPVQSPNKWEEGSADDGEEEQESQRKKSKIPRRVGGTPVSSSGEAFSLGSSSPERR